MAGRGHADQPVDRPRGRRAPARVRSLEPGRPAFPGADVREARARHHPCRGDPAPLERQTLPAQVARAQGRAGRFHPDAEEPGRRCSQRGEAARPAQRCEWASGSGSRFERRLQRCDPPIPSPGQRLDERRHQGDVPQGGPDFLDAVVQPLVEVHEGLAIPQVRPQLLAGDDIARPGKQEGEQAARLIAQAHRRAGNPKLPARGVEFEAAGAQHGGGHDAKVTSSSV